MSFSKRSDAVREIQVYQSELIVHHELLTRELLYLTPQVISLQKLLKQLGFQGPEVTMLIILYLKECLPRVELRVF
jgi:hypothetical protein